ncbi:hypothetical protein ACJYUN_16180 [Klebsiella pneumoniae]|uniref:hypothetical protein n=1 Tax=Klebsiella pneumoniae TaxID=573 RepID=UPI0038D1F3A7
MYSYTFNKKLMRKKECLMFIKDIIPPIFLGLFGILGTLGGVLITNHQNSINEKESRLYAYQTKIIEQRISLVDRAAKIFGKSPGLQDVWKEYIDTVKNDKVDQLIVDKLTEAQGEFQSIIFLSSVYFGPKTQQALKDLDAYPGPWWTKPKEKQDNLVSSMALEINYEIKSQYDSRVIN